MPDNPANFAYRLDRVERDLDHVKVRIEKDAEIAREVAVLRAKYDAHTSEVEKRLAHLELVVENDVKGLRKLLITFSLTVAGSAVAFAVTTLVVFGGPG